MVDEDFTGALVLVVGPSGAGKDTLIGKARERLSRDKRFVFPRRLVTRTAMADLEDHESIDRAEFARMREAGDFALCWEAHGLGYMLPAKINDMLADGLVVVCNVSRRVIGDAMEKYPNCGVVLITADLHLRAERLAARGRESTSAIEARLQREGAPVPPEAHPVIIDNSRELEEGVTAFANSLREIADRIGAGTREAAR